MNILYVHGFGGAEGGALERALVSEAADQGHRVIVVRWPTGNLNKLMFGTIAKAIGHFASDHNSLRGMARALAILSSDGDRHWTSSLAALQRGQVLIRGAMGHLARRGEPFSVVAFSLGCRATLLALRSTTKPYPSLHRAVFAGAAAPPAAFRSLPSFLLSIESPKLVNVYSQSDWVLQWLYPWFQGNDSAGGRPIHVDGVIDVELNVGHTSYATVATSLLRSATE